MALNPETCLRDVCALIRTLHHRDRTAAGEVIDSMDPDELAGCLASSIGLAVLFAENLIQRNGAGTVDELLNEVMRTL